MVSGGRRRELRVRLALSEKAHHFPGRKEGGREGE